MVRFGGDLQERDVALILDAFEEFAVARERAYLLIDLKGLGRVTAEARRMAGMRQLPPQYAGLSLFGGSFEQQLVAKLATMAGWLLRGRALGKPMPLCVVCPSAQWYRIEDDKGEAHLECFCTEFRGVMFDRRKRGVTACDGRTDAVERDRARATQG